MMLYNYVIFGQPNCNLILDICSCLCQCKGYYSILGGFNFLGSQLPVLVVQFTQWSIIAMLMCQPNFHLSFFIPFARHLFCCPCFTIYQLTITIFDLCIHPYSFMCKRYSLECDCTCIYSVYGKRVIIYIYNYIIFIFIFTYIHIFLLHRAQLPLQPEV